MKKNRLNTFIGLAAAACLALSPVLAFAEEESDSSDADGLGEIVYVFADAAGEAERCVNSEQEEVPADASPVNITVTYLLDGEETAPEEMAGKAGEVTIRFDYEPASYYTAEISGEEKEVPAPFAAVTGLILSDEHFSNIRVVNGRSINDGRRTIVIGLGLPGLAEGLGLDSDILDLPESFEITADTDCFELDMTLSVITDEIFRSRKLEDLLLSGHPGDPREALTEAAEQLSGEYSRISGLITSLLTGSDELVSGIDELTGGAQALADGLGTLSGNNEALTDGALEIFTSLLSMADVQLSDAGLEVPELTVENYGDTLDNVLDSLSDEKVMELAREKVTEAVNAQRGLVKEKVTEAVRAEVEVKVEDAVRNEVKNQVILAGAGMPRILYDAEVAAGRIDEETQAKVEDAIEEQMATEDVQAIIAEKINEQMEGDEVASIIEEKTDEQVEILIEENMQGDEVAENIAAAAEGREAISSLKESLDSYNTFYSGLLTYTQGVAEAAAGASTLNEGVSTLSGTLTELAGAAEEKIAGVLEQVRAMNTAGDEYHRSFSEQDGGQRLSFIYRTAGIIVK